MDELKRDKIIVQDIEKIIVYEGHMILSNDYEPQYSCAIYEIVSIDESVYTVKDKEEAIEDQRHLA